VRVPLRSLFHRAFRCLAGDGALDFVICLDKPMVGAVDVDSIHLVDVCFAISDGLRGGDPSLFRCDSVFALPRSSICKCFIESERVSFFGDDWCSMGGLPHPPHQWAFVSWLYLFYGICAVIS